MKYIPILSFGSKDSLRFWAKVCVRGTSECWPWTGAATAAGYGIFRHRGKNLGSNRVAHFLAHGPIRDGLCCLHTCDNPRCCNPEHLYLGTDMDNKRDMVERRRAVRGERHHKVVHPDSFVAQVVSAHRATGQTVAATAREFGLSYPTAHHWVTGKYRSSALLAPA